MKKIQGPKGIPQPMPTTSVRPPVAQKPAAPVKQAAAFPQTGWTDAGKTSKPAQAQQVDNPRLALLHPHRPDPISGGDAVRGPIAARHGVLRPREAIEVHSVRPTIPFRFEPRAGIATEPRRGHSVH